MPGINPRYSGTVTTYSWHPVPIQQSQVPSAYTRCLYSNPSTAKRTTRGAFAEIVLQSGSRRATWASLPTANRLTGLVRHSDGSNPLQHALVAQVSMPNASQQVGAGPMQRARSRAPSQRSASVSAQVSMTNVLQQVDAGSLQRARSMAPSQRSTSVSAQVSTTNASQQVDAGSLQRARTMAPSQRSTSVSIRSAPAPVGRFSTVPEAVAMESDRWRKRHRVPEGVRVFCIAGTGKHSGALLFPNP